MSRLLLVFVIAACAPTRDEPTDDPPPAPDGMPGDCFSDVGRCDGTTYQVCVDGRWTDDQRCETPERCIGGLGCAMCDPALGTVCVGDDVHRCLSDGTIGDFDHSCGFEACSGGHCTDPCGKAAERRSYIGCEYWPVDLDNATEIFFAPTDDVTQCSSWSDNPVVQTIRGCTSGPGSAISGLCDYGDDCSAAGAGYSCGDVTTCVIDAQYSRFAIVVSNPSDVDPVDVTLENKSGNFAVVTLQAGEVRSLYPADLGLPDQSLDFSGIRAQAYRLTSTLPVVAYQFNPLDDERVFSNDGSLLLPVHSYHNWYYAASYPSLSRRPLMHDYNGYITVVASAKGQTEVTVEVAVAVRPGEGVPAFGPGSFVFSLEQWDTLTLEAVAGSDLTGAVVLSDKPVGAFGGHEAATLFETTSICCADHLEDQLFPAATWGKDYVVVRTEPRMSELSGAAVADLVRVVAQKPNTIVSFDGALGGCDLQPGEYCDRFVQDHTQVTANEPILVAHYMSGAGGVGDATGDPSMSYAVPTEQYRTEYAVLVPDKYKFNYFSLVTPAGGTVVVDDADVTSSLTAFGSGAFDAGRIPIAPGAHTITCPDSCGVEIYGWSDAVSYLFAGGLDLELIAVP